MWGFIAIVLLVVFYVSFSSRLKKLEDKVFGSATAINAPVTSLPQQNVLNENLGNVEHNKPMTEIQNGISAQDSIAPSHLPAEKNYVQKFITWLADEWPLKVGIFLLILAVGWFITYAFINDWIGEVGRVSLGIVFGIITLSVGYYRASKHQLQGNALLVLGATATLISIISGIGLYHLFPASVALVVAFALTVFMTLVAWQQKNLSLGVVTLLMGSIVPIFIFYSIDISVIFLYLFVLSAGTLWVSGKTGWNSLNVIALLVVFFYSVAYNSFEGFDDDFINLVFAFAFIFLFFIANTFTILYKSATDGLDLVVSGGTGFLFLIWMLMIAPEGLLVYLVIFGAFLFALGAYLIFVITKSKDPIILYAAIAGMLLLSATAIEFKGWELTVAYIIEFSLFIMISLYLRKTGGITSKSATEALGIVAYIFLVALSFSNIERIFEYLSFKDSAAMGRGGNHLINGMRSMNINSDLVVLFLLGIMSFVITIFIIQLFNNSENKYLNLARFYGVIGGFYAVLLIWIMIHLILTSQVVATMIALIIYTIIGVWFYAIGKRHAHGLYKSIGGILFGIVLIHLFLVEFANMDIIGKIFTFFVIGILFVSTTFIGGKGKHEIIENN